ncbi:cyclin-H [Galleria mellonella]|uniref:Cyclin-H n=1 Tax=Galleria mellonella TaxID=7137 RepID=A0A6J1X2T9_GALME|nr:cyclin-H [Galleria mellonella]
MFSTSTQRKFWTFSDETELARLREKHNLQYISKHGSNTDEYQPYNIFLSPEEEGLLLKQYELHMKEFCKRFSPPMPKGVVGTAFHYFKRFYLYNSTMDYHPKEILATCVYLACKVEEFNVSIGQFVANIKGDREKASDIILNNELLLMQQLNYHLTIHNPFRPVEGFLIDIKTRCTLPNPERLRSGIDEFLEKVFLTDACLLYAPSQIALAAVLHSASKEQENLDSYVTEILFIDAGPDKLAILIEAVRKIRSLVKMVENPVRERVKIIEKKLDRCRNQENNPDSEIYKRRMRETLDEDDMPYSGTSRMSLDTSGVTQVLSPSAS